MTSGQSRMRSRGPDLLLLAASTLLGLMLLETALRLFTPFPVTSETNRVFHPKLGYVIDSRYPWGGPERLPQPAGCAGRG